jgi:cephalosporin hydroxylase
VLGSDALSAVLLAIVTGHTDRAVNVVATSTEVDEEARAALWAVLLESNRRSEQARRFGDALRSLGAERSLVNECYRVAFYTSEAWKALSINPLFAYFTANRAGDPLDKWVHYFPIYERHLSRYRSRPVRLLEIGVYRGGGLELLRHYLGPEASLVGIDNDEEARFAVGDRYPVELGDQADPAFLARVVEAHGPFDIVIDDGGHTMNQQIASVETLFPLLNEGGTYLVEDCHTSYWPEYADGSPGGLTFVGWVKARIDDLHAHHYSLALDLEAPWQTHLAGLHAYDSVVVLDKARAPAPFSELSGTGEFIGFNRDVSLLQLEMLASRDAALARSAEADARAEQAISQAAAASDEAREEVRVLRGELVDAQQTAAQLQADFETTRVELESTRGDLLGSWGIIQEMRRSRSWRITAPLRRMKSLVRRR